VANLVRRLEAHTRALLALGVARRALRTRWTGAQCHGAFDGFVDHHTATASHVAAATLPVSRLMKGCLGHRRGALLPRTARDWSSGAVATFTPSARGAASSAVLADPQQLQPAPGGLPSLRDGVAGQRASTAGLPTPVDTCTCPDRRDNWISTSPVDVANVTSLSRPGTSHSVTRAAARWQPAIR
jgi:hypothetical protein